MRSAHTRPSETGRKAASARLRKVHPHSKSEYAPIRDTVHHKSPTSVPSLLPRRDFEGVGSGRDRVPDKQYRWKSGGGIGDDERVARAIRRFYGHKAASFLSLRRSLVNIISHRS